MGWLASVSVRRAVFASVLVLGVVVIGVAGYSDLGVDAFPSSDRPFVTVVTYLPGAAPAEVESQVTERIEAAVNTIAGVYELSSQSSEGASVVYIQFDMEKDIDVAVQEVRDNLQRILHTLPQGIDPPLVGKLDLDAVPVLYVAVRSDRSLSETTELAERRVLRALENTMGVGQVLVLGGRRRQIDVILDAERLRSYQLTAFDVQRAFATQNLSVPGGTIRTGPRDVSLRVQARVTTLEEIGRLVVRSAGGRVIRVQDVARVEDGEEDLESFASLDGQPTVLLAIQKQSGENIVAVADAVRERLASLERTLPAGCSLEVVRDLSAGIRTQVAAVEEHLVLGAILAALVVLLFLGSVRSTVIAALAIPISILGSFGLMWTQGFTLNLITLLALALSVGIVIDDAIVVLENVVRFIRDQKVKPFPAAILATRDIGLAVLATTLSLMAVFLPVTFMPGMVGRLMRHFGLTMAFAIAVSMFVSFTLTPMLASRWLKPGDERARRPVLERLVDRLYLPVEATYVGLLRFVMRRRWIVVAASALAMLSCVPLMKLVKASFLPPNDEANFQVNLRAPEGSSLEATRLAAERVARDVRALPGVEHTIVTIGGTNQRGTNLAQVYVRLVDPRERAATQEQLIERTRREVLSRQPRALRLDVSDVSVYEIGSRKPVQYVISGQDPAEFARLAAAVIEQVRRAPGAVDVDSNLAAGRPEVRLEVLRDRAADLGVRVSDVVGTVQLLVAGLKVSTFEQGGEDYDIRLRADRAERSQLDRLDLLLVPSSTVGSVPLGSLVRRATGEAPSQINRINRQRQVTIGANVAPGYGQNEVQQAFEDAIEAAHLPDGYVAAPGMMTREMQRMAESFVVAFVLSFVFMYLVLAAQFESWLHPLTIMLCLPLTVPFALLSLVLLGQTFNMLSALGLLVLFGVVKKNSILQVDHTNALRAKGLPRDEAILEANRHRLRPILMTTIAFVAGMLPLVAAEGIGAGFNHATAGIIVGGQTLSLVLTLLATPVFYSLFDDASAWLRRTVLRGERVDRGQEELELASRA